MIHVKIRSSSSQLILTWQFYSADHQICIQCLGFFAHNGNVLYLYLDCFLLGLEHFLRHYEHR